jgi:surface protein
MGKFINNIFRIQTPINNENIKKYVEYYIKNKNRLPWDLKDKQIGDWDVSRVTDMSELFADRENFNEPLNDWDVSNVTNMKKMFYGCYTFNQSLNKWDVSKVHDMAKMFYGCYTFNQSLNKWDVSKVHDMAKMFLSCRNFNKPFFNEELNRTWNVSNVTNMDSMFAGCTSFNQSLNDWDVSNVTNMDSMFAGCTSFDEPLNNWNVINVANMTFMFSGCRNFNRPLNNWNVSRVYSMSYMFSGCIAFNQPLNNWFDHIRRLPLDNRRDIFLNCPVSRQFNNTPSVPPRVNATPPRVNATQIHKEATKIKYNELNGFLSEKSGNSVMPNNLNYPNYIEETINAFINESDEPEETKTPQRNGLQSIVNERLNGFNYNNLDSDVRNSIFYSLNYVKSQSPIFKKTYVDTFIKDCVNAYEGANGMTCVNGAVERFVFSLLPACAASQDNPDCSTIIPLITGLQDYILDWFKLHSPNHSTYVNEPFPSDPKDRKENLRQYLLTKLPSPSQKAIIEEAIKTWADGMGYDDDAFTFQNRGGRRRKTIKRKTNKKRINKRKTNKKRINKRKTIKRI